MLSIPNTLVISLESVSSVLTQSDWDSAKNDKSQMQENSAVPVRVTMKGEASVTSIERLTERGLSYHDVGKNPGFDGGSVTFDALLNFGDGSKPAFLPGVGMTDKPHACLMLLPLSIDPRNSESVKGYFCESFDLRFNFLPCVLGTTAGDKYPGSFHSGYAYVNTETQQVEDLVVDDSVDESAYGIPVESDRPDCIKVGCKFANGGCNFGRTFKL